MLYNNYGKRLKVSQYCDPCKKTQHIRVYVTERGKSLRYD